MIKNKKKYFEIFSDSAFFPILYSAREKKKIKKGKYDFSANSVEGCGYGH
jgi:hypothetical protein